LPEVSEELDLPEGRGCGFDRAVRNREFANEESYGSLAWQ